MSPTGASAADTDKATQELKPPVEGQDVATGATGTGPVEPQGDEGQQPKASRSQTAKTVVTSAAKSIVYMHRKSFPLFLNVRFKSTDSVKPGIFFTSSCLLDG